MIKTLKPFYPCQAFTQRLLQPVFTLLVALKHLSKAPLAAQHAKRQSKPAATIKDIVAGVCVCVCA